MNFKKYIGTEYTHSYKEIILILFFSIFFILGFSFEKYGLAIIPFAFLGAILLFIDLKLGFYLTAMILPFSINISLGFIDINTPLEPLLFVLTISSLYHIFFKGIQIPILTHPISLLVLALCTLYFISSCFSTMPLVSLRIVIQTLGFIIPSFWGLLYCSQTDRTFPIKILITVLISFAMICTINFIEHAQHSFSRMYAGDVPYPFYQEHTIYSAMAGLMIPLAFILTAWFAQRNTLKFLLFAGIFMLSVSALILSYSRAALLSIIIAFLVYALIKLKIHWIIVCSMFLLGSLILVSQQEKILMSLRRNQIESKTKKTDVEKQLKSMVNVSNDVSNLERINRWKSAFRMIEEKPFLGFGFGTYQYKYFAYQKESEMTSISIRNPQSHYLAGTGGTTHSEYLLMSSENGILTGITYALVLASAIYYMLKNIKLIDSKSYTYYLILGIGMSITTYIIHSFFNNFLDASKIIFVFYAMLASLVSLDNSIQESISKKI